MYFDNDKVEEKILKYQETKDQEIIVELLPVFETLITGVINRYKLFRQNIINEDIKQEARCGIIETLHKWKKSNGDAFSFFTAVVKNKIFWLLKNQYKDTSEIPKDLQIECKEAREDITIEQPIENTEIKEFEIKEFINSITLPMLKIKSTQQNVEILKELKRRIVVNGRIESVNKHTLIKEIQKETKIPKKDIEAIIQAIYKLHTS